MVLELSKHPTGCDYQGATTFNFASKDKQSPPYFVCGYSSDAVGTANAQKNVLSMV